MASIDKTPPCSLKLSLPIWYIIQHDRYDIKIIFFTLIQCGRDQTQRTDQQEGGIASLSSRLGQKSAPRTQLPYLQFQIHLEFVWFVLHGYATIVVDMDPAVIGYQHHVQRTEIQKLGRRRRILPLPKTGRVAESLIGHFEVHGERSELHLLRRFPMYSCLSMIYVTKRAISTGRGVKPF